MCDSLAVLIRSYEKMINLINTIHKQVIRRCELNYSFSYGEFGIQRKRRQKLLNVKLVEWCLLFLGRGRLLGGKCVKSCPKKVLTTVQSNNTNLDFCSIRLFIMLIRYHIGVSFTHSEVGILLATVHLRMTVRPRKDDAVPDVLGVRWEPQFPGHLLPIADEEKLVTAVWISGPGPCLDWRTLFLNKGPDLIGFLK